MQTLVMGDPQITFWSTIFLGKILTFLTPKMGFLTPPPNMHNLQILVMVDPQMTFGAKYIFSNFGIFDYPNGHFDSRQNMQIFVMGYPQMTFGGNRANIIFCLFWHF